MLKKHSITILVLAGLISACTEKPNPNVTLQEALQYPSSIDKVNLDKPPVIKVTSCLNHSKSEDYVLWKCAEIYTGKDSSLQMNAHLHVQDTNVEHKNKKLNVIDADLGNEMVGVKLTRSNDIVYVTHVEFIDIIEDPMGIEIPLLQKCVFETMKVSLRLPGFKDDSQHIAKANSQSRCYHAIDSHVN